MNATIALRTILCLTILAVGLLAVTGCGEQGAAKPNAGEEGHAAHAGHEGHHDHGGHDEHKDEHEEEHEHGEHADEVTLSAEAIAKAGIRVAPAGKHALRDVVLAPARVSLDMERGRGFRMPCRSPGNRPAGRRRSPCGWATP
ncbi:MAG: hypothetical protein NTW19_03700 [Planctomycetota bacterium]|nr:hypothetical protein [Planctomycetota bacterium]